MRSEDRQKLVEVLRYLGCKDEGLAEMPDSEVETECRMYWRNWNAEGIPEKPTHAWKLLHEVFGDPAIVEKAEGLTGYKVMVGNKRIYYVSAGFAKDPKKVARRAAIEYNFFGDFSPWWEDRK